MTFMLSSILLYVHLLIDAHRLTRLSLMKVEGQLSQVHLGDAFMFYLKVNTFKGLKVSYLLKQKLHTSE